MKESVVFLSLLIVALVGCKQRMKDGDAAVSTSTVDVSMNDVKFGTFAIKPQFDEASPFSDGLARVRIGDVKGGRYGYINKKGVFKINPQYSKADSFHEGLAAVAVQANGETKWGYIRRDGSSAIAPQFDAATGFEDGHATVRVGGEMGKWGVIDKAGTFVVNPQYLGVIRVGKDRWAAEFEGHEKTPAGLIDSRGSVVLPPQFGSIFTFADFQDDVAVATVLGTTGSECGYIDMTGRLVINPTYSSCSPFREGLAAVRKTIDQVEYWGFIDRNGTNIIKEQFSYTSSFHEGLAAVLIGTGEAAKWGYVDKKGTLKINPQFDEVGDFENGYAHVRVGGGAGFQEMDEWSGGRFNGPQKHIHAGKWGVINREGHFVINPQFDLLTNPSEHLIPARIGGFQTGKWGFVQL